MATIQFIASAFPSGVELSYQGMLPLHCACRTGATRSILEWWWKEYPAVFQTCTMDTGDTPLHCFLSSSINTTSTGARISQYLSAMQFLLEKQPGVLRRTNRFGFLPFHVAALHHAPLDALFQLACQDPEGLLCHSPECPHDCRNVISEAQVMKKRKFSTLSGND